MKVNYVNLTINLRVKIVKAKEGCYIVECPAFKIYTQGESIEDAKRNIKEAVWLWFEVAANKSLRKPDFEIK